MTPDDFDRIFGDLKDSIDPRGWKTSKEVQYFRQMRTWTAAEFESVCEWMMRNRIRKEGMTAFPEIPEFFKVRNMLTTADPAENAIRPDVLSSCQHCLEGKIWFERERRGQIYEYLSACDCTSGTIIAEDLLQISRRLRRQGSMETVRYSFAVRNEGGIATASGGFGLMYAKPTVDEGAIKELAQKAMAMADISKADRKQTSTSTRQLRQLL